eukprot:1387156-Alexandrium_andersonii.AAC.1
MGRRLHRWHADGRGAYNARTNGAEWAAQASRARSWRGQVLHPKPAPPPRVQSCCLLRRQGSGERHQLRQHWPGARRQCRACVSACLPLLKAPAGLDAGFAEGRPGGDRQDT